MEMKVVGRKKLGSPSSSAGQLIAQVYRKLTVNRHQSRAFYSHGRKRNESRRSESWQHNALNNTRQQKRAAAVFLVKFLASPTSKRISQSP